MNTKVQDYRNLPRAKYESQAPEIKEIQQDAVRPNALIIPPGTAELLKLESQERSTEAENYTTLDNIQIRRDKSNELDELQRAELRKKWLLNAKKKHLQAPFMSDMIDYYNEKKDWKFERKFTRTYFCRHSYLVTYEGRALTIRCENRWCNYCSNVRAAKLRDRYANVLSELNEVWFVTLTAYPVKPGEGRLKERIQLYKKIWSKLIGRYKKRSQRSGNSSRIRGLRKLEIEISKNKLTHGYYHAHFHIITEGTESFMREFIADWIAELSDNGVKATTRAQKAIRAQRDENGLIKMSELTKYVTKSLTEDPETGELKQVAQAAFAEIWEAVQGIRLIHPIDIKGEKVEDEEEDGDSDWLTMSQAPPDAVPGHYIFTGNDWKSTGDQSLQLAGYEPDKPTTKKHLRERPEWLINSHAFAFEAIARSAFKMGIDRVDLPDTLPYLTDKEKEGKP